MTQEAGRKNQVSRIKSFTDLVAWQKGHDLVLWVYKLVKNFPASEQYALTNQLTRAAVSVTCNIAEGFSRSTAPDKAHFYTMSQGSITEVQNLLLIARDLCYIDKLQFQEVANLSITCHQLTTGLIKKTKE